MIKQIVGGVLTLAIGGTIYQISQADVAKNLSQNTGMTQQQAQQYVSNIKQSDLESFANAGQEFIDDANTVQGTISQIDCENYTYSWETPLLSCSDAKSQLQTLANDENNLGNCYKALDANLQNYATSKINECISDIDTVNSDDRLPVATTLLDSKTLTDASNRNNYNKSVLQAALQSQ